MSLFLYCANRFIKKKFRIPVNPGAPQKSNNVHVQLLIDLLEHFFFCPANGTCIGCFILNGISANLADIIIHFLAFVEIFTGFFVERGMDLFYFIGYMETPFG